MWNQTKLIFGRNKICKTYTLPASTIKRLGCAQDSGTINYKSKVATGR